MVNRIMVTQRRPYKPYGKQYRLWLLTLLCVFFLIMLGACAAQNETVTVDHLDDTLLTLPRLSDPDQRNKPPAPSETPLNTTETLTDTTDTADRSRLTGLPISAEAAVKRPIAVVVNNIYRALPQSGISQAEIIYEVLAEANITRLVAIFQEHDAPKIGPVRSARDYFVDFALDYDAIFVHHGGSPSGYARLNGLKINRLDGINLEGPYFWRDRTYPSWDSQHGGTQRPMEHSSYTSSKNIIAASASFSFRDNLLEDTHFGFEFISETGVLPEPLENNALTAPAANATDEQTAAGEQLSSAPAMASVVKVPFSKEYTRTFTYDADTGLYTVANKNGTHKDEATAEALTVSNILIQFVSMRVIPGDEAGRREVHTLGEGTGYLATAGIYTPIKWAKADHTEPTRWYKEDGTPMQLNTGKTWICVFQDNGTPEFEA